MSWCNAGMHTSRLKKSTWFTLSSYSYQGDLRHEEYVVRGPHFGGAKQAFLYALPWGIFFFFWQAVA
jgi:hypothetical protein